MSLQKHLELIHAKNADNSLSYTPTLVIKNKQIYDERKNKFKCKSCFRTFRNQSSLIYHRDAEHNTLRRFVCSKCDKPFKHKQLLQRHQIVHSEDRPFSCKSCDASFKVCVVCIIFLYIVNWFMFQNLFML